MRILHSRLTMTISTQLVADLKNVCDDLGITLSRITSYCIADWIESGHRPMTSLYPKGKCVLDLEAGLPERIKQYALTVGVPKNIIVESFLGSLLERLQTFRSTLHW